jgi:trk system potassium uptake protein TrkA
VEEAVTVGDLVRLFTFRQGNANLVEMTLPADSPYVGKPAGLIPFPENCALVTILRDGQVYVPDAEWLLADSCELSSLEEARLQDCDVVIAATGDDKANLVTALLAKTEFGVPRTVGRVNHPNNEWLFTEAWGVDVSVSTPRIMSALVEEAVTVGDLVRLFTFRQGNANLVELTLPPESPYVGKPAGLIPFPENCALVTILRAGRVYPAGPRNPNESGDELLFVAGAEVEDALEKMLAPGSHGG